MNSPRSLSFYTDNRATDSFNYKPPKDCCFKVFVVAVIALGAVALIFGILTVFACNGYFKGISTMTQLVGIGEVNGYVMAVGGFVLTTASFLAWACYIRRENHRMLQYLKRN